MQHIGQIKVDSDLMAEFESHVQTIPGYREIRRSAPLWDPMRRNVRMIIIDCACSEFESVDETEPLPLYDVWFHRSSNGEVKFQSVHRV